MLRLTIISIITLTRTDIIMFNLFYFIISRRIIMMSTRMINMSTRMIHCILFKIKVILDKCMYRCY